MYGMVMMVALAAGGEAPNGYWVRGGWYPSCYGCYGYGCYSDPLRHGGHGSYPGCYGCSGCAGWGCYGCWGTAPYFQMDHVPAPGTPVMPGADIRLHPQDSLALASKARLIIEVPADAKLFIDDQPTKATTAVRTFSTPELKQGQTYYYILKAEVLREGTARIETKKVLIKVGDEIKASFTEESIAAAARETSTAKR